MKLIKVTRARRNEFRERIGALESIATYPLGTDRFKIDHGGDYFEFFDRLGALHYYAMLDGRRVVAVGCGMIRSKPYRTWYLADLKVHPDYRGRHIPLRMLARAFLPNYLRCRRGYAVSMNPSDGTPNRIAKLLARFPWISIRAAGVLELFSLSETEMRDILPTITKHRGPVSFLSLQGVKDIVLQSTGRPLPLLHAQFGPCAQTGTPHPVAGHVHMLCTPASDPLSLALKSAGLSPSGLATVIHHGMAQEAWDFVLTSDI